jgi:hypothetical protein
VVIFEVFSGVGVVILPDASPDELASISSITVGVTSVINPDELHAVTMKIIPAESNNIFPVLVSSFAIQLEVKVIELNRLIR